MTRSCSAARKLIDLFDVKDCNSKASRLDMAKLGWVNQHFLKTEGRGRHRAAPGLPAAEAGPGRGRRPGPEDVVIALRERVQTLKEMAEKAVVWYQPLTGYDEAAVAKHLKAGAEVALGKARELLAALPE